MKYITTVLVLCILILLGAMYLKPQEIGSVTQGNEYNATTTSSVTTGGFSTINPRLIKGGAGAFGSVIVATTGTAGGNMNFYDATTSNVLLRGSVATTSIIIASIPNNLAAGTYVFDIVFTKGLLLDWSGTVGTTTITYR